MEFETKYNIGDTVYSIHSSEPMEIDKITIEYIYGKCEISYGVISSEKVKRYFFEKNLTKERPKPKPKTIYDLANGDEYFFISSRGRITSKVYYGSEIDKHINQGNAFLTEEEATKEVKRRKIHQELKRLAGGYEFINGEKNWHLRYEPVGLLAPYWDDIYYSPNEVYFSHFNDVQNAIDKIGEDVLLRDYFGIEPDEK